MARCINKNLNEFKEVANVMGSPILANSLITSWQDSNNSDLIPTVTEALEFDKKTKALFNLKRREFTEALYANLVREKILTKYKGNYYIVSSKNRIFDPNIRKFNKGRLYSYLRINNIDSNSVVEATKGAGLTITINQSIFTPRDIISESRDFDTPHAREVVRHLMRADLITDGVQWRHGHHWFLENNRYSTPPYGPYFRPPIFQLGDVDDFAVAPWVREQNLTVGNGSRVRQDAHNRLGDDRFSGTALAHQRNGRTRCDIERDPSDSFDRDAVHVEVDLQVANT